MWTDASLPQQGYSASLGAGFLKRVDGDRRFREVKPGKYEDRLPCELARFGAGLKSINDWYQHQFSVSLRVDLPIDAAVVANKRSCTTRTARMPDVLVAASPAWRILAAADTTGVCAAAAF